MTDQKAEYYMIRSDVLPDVFRKVMQVKRLVDSDDSLSINEATKRVGISRSAYYKYREAVLPAHREHVESSGLLIVTEDLEQVVSRCLQELSEANVTVLSLHRHESGTGMIYLMLSLDCAPHGREMLHVQRRLAGMRGVRRIELLE